MKRKLGTVLSAILISAVSVFLTGCNTVQGAFQGAGRDTAVLASQLQLNDAPPRHYYYKQKTQVTKTSSAKSGGRTATTTTTTTVTQ